MDQTPGIAISWAPCDTPPVMADCRCCGAGGAKPVRLTARADLPDQGVMDVRLLDCPSCGCAFVETPPPYDYAGQAADALSTETYVEAGAGIWPIVRTLARVPKPAGARYLEVGCGFGFGLDFAIRAKSWQGQGVDPSPLAKAGAAWLRLPIEHRFFGTSPGDIAGQGQASADIILASEVVEHMPDPPGFIAMLGAKLAQDGILVLTTPDLAQLRPDASFATQVPILSVGAHLALHTAASLHGLLARAGFADIHVEASGAQLVAYASHTMLVLEASEPGLRLQYRDYLQSRLTTVDNGTMLWWGFAGRAYQEAVADHDRQPAAALWRQWRQACQLRFGFDPDQPGQIPPLAGLDLEQLALRVPKALPAMLYARALDRLHAGDTLADLAGLLAAIDSAAASLNAALLAHGAADLSALSAQRAALACLLGLAADTAAPDCLDVLRRAIDADPAGAESLARRGFVGLVNAGDLARAEALRAHWDIGAQALTTVLPDAKLSDAERDTLFCLGIAALHRAGADEEARHCFAGVRGRCQASPDFVWAALRGECIALDRLERHAEATALLREADVSEMPSDLRERLGSA